MTARFTIVAAMLAVLLTPPAASAQEDDVYRDLVHRAVQEHAAGRYGEARALFRRAHQRSPNARTLRGIGMTNFELRQYGPAIAALEESLAETRRPLTEAQQASVRSLLERADAFVARYTLEPAAALDGVRVDGVAGIVSPSGVLLVDIGTHDVEVRCDSCREEPRRVRVTGGEEGTLDFTRAPIVEEPDPVVVEPPSNAAPIALIAAGGALGLGAVGVGLWWRDRNAEIDTCDGRAGCLNRDRLSTERNATAGVTLGLAVAAVGLATVGLLLLTGDDDEDETRGARCALAGAGVACAGWF